MSYKMVVIEVPARRKVMWEAPNGQMREGRVIGTWTGDPFGKAGWMFVNAPVGAKVVVEDGDPVPQALMADALTPVPLRPSDPSMWIGDWA